ncbi:MAG: hypothetical protein ABIY70_08095 [Capsulimonas sp.]|uniref:hypothetical protein n=1 Tax=Capsulimonas sp. TaxID=2494211 RepID=UPI0032649EBA
MTVTLDLTDEEWTLLDTRAQSEGISREDLLRRLIAQLAPPQPPRATAAQISALRGEAPIDDPEELAEREREHEEMQNNIARWRADQER